MDDVEDFHTVDSWGVTDLTCNTTIFHWTIKDFMYVSNAGASVVCSEKFAESGSTEAYSRMREWKIMIRPHKSQMAGREFLSVYLYLLSNPLKINPGGTGEYFSAEEERERKTWSAFKITINDDKGNALMHAGGLDSQYHPYALKIGRGFNNFVAVDLLQEKDSKFLPGGNLHLTCQIWTNADGQNFRVGKGGAWPRQQMPDMEERKQRGLQEDFRRLFRDGTLADVTIRVMYSDKESSYLAHKVVLAASSPVFLAMFNTRQVATTQEYQEGVVNITDFDGPVVHAMLEYMYTKSIDSDFLQQNAVDLLWIADKYGLVPLREMCEENIYKNLDLGNCMQLLVIADMHQFTWLKTKCMGFIEANRKPVKET